jgi:hypothetical protein
MRILLCMFVLFLSGCSMINRFIIAPFDSNEYALVNRVKTYAITSKQYCNDGQQITTIAKTINLTTIELKNYSEHLPNNTQTYQPVVLLQKMAQDLDDRYSKNTTVSKTYCELKLQSIFEAADTIQKTIAKRPR